MALGKALSSKHQEIPFLLIDHQRVTEEGFNVAEMIFLVAADFSLRSVAPVY